MIVMRLRWSDVDPAAHPFDPELARGPLEALVTEAARGDIDRNAVVHDIERTFCITYGAWAGGWQWSPHMSGPVNGWCCSDDSVLRADDPDALATAHRALAALASWRSFLEELAGRFEVLRAEAAELSLEAAVERAAARLLPLVLERTGAEEVWSQTLMFALQRYLDTLAGEPLSHALETAIERSLQGVFASWTVPDAPTAQRGCAAVAAAAAAAPDAPPDALAAWLEHRPSGYGHVALPARPAVPDGHARYIDEVDRRRDPLRADRMAAALILCRDSAHRGMPLTLDQLAEWQGVVLGGSAPAPFRTQPAFAKGGRERYGLSPDTQLRFEAALAEAHGPGPLWVRAARAYLDVCFFHPFDDGNARAARLALDHVLTAAGWALTVGGPAFGLSRAADDPFALDSLVYVLDRIAGPRAA